MWADSESLKFLAQDEKGAGFILHYNGTPVGVGLFDIRNNDVSTACGPWLYLLWIEPQHRGHGFDVEVTRLRMNHARKHGYKEVHLDTIDAEKYHAYLGWKKVATILFNGEPDVIMR